MNYQVLVTVQWVLGRGDGTAVWTSAAKPDDLSAVLELTWQRR